MNRTIGQRFAELLNLLKMSNNAFAKSIGKSASAINFIVDGKTKPGFDILEAVFSQYPDVNPNWLMRGNGEVFLNSSDNKATQNESADYLYEHLKALEENFRKLTAQLESKDTQIAGLQRTVDALLSNPNPAQARQATQERQSSFNKPVSTTGKIVPLNSRESREEKKKVA